ncbi:MAG: ArsR family transcriptional regulator, partial [Thermoplasmata archaeon]|nr:ArsR family transcriptional regulator [Thermoplasmata archaeon]
SYMRKRGEVTSVEIEKNTTLRQPEVSIAMQWLKKRGWVTKRDLKKEGKGRPVHGYRLSKPFPKIVEEINKELRKKIKDIEDLIKSLNSFS